MSQKLKFRYFGCYWREHISSCGIESIKHNKAMYDADCNRISCHCEVCSEVRAYFVLIVVSASIVKANFYDKFLILCTLQQEKSCMI